MSVRNEYCTTLGIEVPRVEHVTSHPDASHYALLIVALLERGSPMTLEEVALRLEDAGVADRHQALASLKRCRPARPPVYRDGAHYALDPFDDEVDLWVFRLGLRPPRAALLRVVRPDERVLPQLDQSLSVAALDEAWRDGVPSGWSAQRTALAVIDAHADAMWPDDVLAFVAARSPFSPLRADSAQYWWSGAVRVRDDGRWEVDRAHPDLRSARQAVIDRLEFVRRWDGMRPDPVALEAHQQRLERERDAHAGRLDALRRVIVHACPTVAPEALVLVDVDRRDVQTYVGDEMPEALARVAAYDVVAAVGVRTLLRVLGIAQGDWRLAELGPPQKTRQINRRGRTLALTTALLIQGSCGISRPLSDERVLIGYLRDGVHTRLRRRLEADAKALCAFYDYGRLHGAVRLCWGYLDEMLPAPWVHRDEVRLPRLMKAAWERQLPLEVVVGAAPGWADPWARRRRVMVATDRWGWPGLLVDEGGRVVPREEVQRARLVAASNSP